MNLKHIIIIFALCSSAAHATKCEISGFFKENCKNPGEFVWSTIFWKAEFDCYHQYGVCEANACGACEWQQTTALQQCLAIIDQKILAADPFPD